MPYVLLITQSQKGYCRTRQDSEKSNASDQRAGNLIYNKQKELKKNYLASERNRPSKTNVHYDEVWRKQIKVFLLPAS